MVTGSHLGGEMGQDKSRLKGSRHEPAPTNQIQKSIVSHAWGLGSLRAHGIMALLAIPPQVKGVIQYTQLRKDRGTALT